MESGDRVVGTPCNSGVRKLHPVVRGRYEVSLWKFMGETQLTEFVVMDDGVAVDCTDIRLENNDGA